MHIAPPPPPSRASAGLRAADRLRLLLAPLRHLPDRLLHARRRAAALARVRAEPLPTSVLFLCEGNIYRSPFAAAALERALPAAWRGAVRIDSAGLVGPGRPSPDDAVRAAARRGVDLARHRSALVTGVHVYAARLVVVMDARQQRLVRERFGVNERDVLLLGDLDPQPVRTRAVADPWRGDAAVLEGAYARVERCVGQLAAALAAGRPGRPAGEGPAGVSAGGGQGLRLPVVGGGR